MLVGDHAMPQVEIPLDLFQQIQAALPTSGGSPDQFVSQAVQEKLDKHEQREEFLRLSDITRHALAARGVTEDEILADFDAWRHTQRSEAQRSQATSNSVGLAPTL
jgi:hypothetical protein